MHGLIFETSVCYWQNQPGFYLYFARGEAKESLHQQASEGPDGVRDPRPTHEVFTLK